MLRPSESVYLTNHDYRDIKSYCKDHPKQGVYVKTHEDQINITLTTTFYLYPLSPKP